MLWDDHLRAGTARVKTLLETGLMLSQSVQASVNL